jgi:hypothetical protein
MFGLVILLNDNKYLVAVDFRGLRNPPNNMAGPYKNISQVDSHLSFGDTVVKSYWGFPGYAR